MRQRRLNAVNALNKDILQLSRASGLHVALQSIRNYERGRSLPGLVNLVCLSSALGVSMDEYTGMKGKYNIPQ